jgi:hypothetical protein
MSFGERSLTTTTSSSTMNAQGSGGSSNPQDEQTEPASTLGIFALDYKK